MFYMMILNLLVMWILIRGVVLSPTQSKILEETNSNDGSGNYHFSFKTSNGLTRNEIGTVKNGPKHIVKGLYSFTDPEGNDVVVQYKSDENGYVTVKDVISAAEATVEAATETPPKAPLPKSPSILLSHQLKIPPLVWVHRPGISPFVLFYQPGIPTFMLFHQPAKLSALPSYQTEISAVQTHNLETLTPVPVIKPQKEPHVPSEPDQITANVPDKITYVPSHPAHPGQISTTVPDSKLHNQTIPIPFVPYNYDDIIDVPNRQSEVTREVVPQPVLISLLGGSPG